MFKELRTVLGAALLALVASAPASAHTHTPDHYAAPCSTGNTYSGQQYWVFPHVYRPLSGDADYKAVKASASITNLQPCTNPTTSAEGFSIIPVVNAEINFDTNDPLITSDNEPWSFVQLGYAEQSCASSCQLTNGIMDFWWTPSDTSNGVIASASWVDFDGGGHDKPIQGERYTFRIEHTQSGLYLDPVWKFCITVVSSQRFTPGVEDCTTAPRSNSNWIDKVYWGAESYNDAGAVGHGSGGALNITPMQYKNSTGSIYTTVTGASCSWAHGPQGNWHWLSQVCSVSGGSGTSTLNVYTNIHD